MWAEQGMLRSFTHTLSVQMNALWCVTAYGVKSTADERDRWREKKKKVQGDLHGAPAVFLNIIRPILINILHRPALTTGAGA